MKRKKIILVIGFLIALLLTGCNCSNAGVSVYEVLQDSPIGHALVTSLNPTFEWHGSDSCEPDNFYMYIKENKPWGYDSTDRTIDGGDSSYTLAGGSLLPGTEYSWMMQARNDYVPGETDDYIGPWSDYDFFYTGPACPGGPLVAPELEVPLGQGGNNENDNWITHSGPQDFQWSYPGGCLPEYYDYQFATDPGFTDIVLSGTTTELYLMHLYETFPNCSSLFWRVAARVGSTVGPWSDAFQFHWVEDETCWQNLYISDDAARINVLLYQDICDQTGLSNTSSTVLSPGCAVNLEENLIYADGQKNLMDWYVWSYTVDLGAGACPSTGLDQMIFDYFAHDEYFNVLAPGTYCVSISKNQTPSQNGPPLDLNDGLWTDPFTHDLIASKTVTVGPGTQDVYLEFGWDEYDLFAIWIPFPEELWCRRAPQPICDPLAFIKQGEMMPILARGPETEWKMTSYKGESCFVYLPAVQLDEVLAGIPGNSLFTEDLPFFDPQPPCPEPEPERECSDIKNQTNCIQAGCKWEDTVSRTPYCTDK